MWLEVMDTTSRYNTRNIYWSSYGRQKKTQIEGAPEVLLGSKAIRGSLVLVILSKAAYQAPVLNYCISRHSIGITLNH